MAMDHFDLHAVMQIYEKSIAHPNLSAIRDWALKELKAHNDQLAADQAKAATVQAPAPAPAPAAVEPEVEDDEEDEE